ncbi:MAG: SDR family oxidoreductase, partial [Firmicutes bacterium]|nr:SDR family oxidoreductase [Bacillota bacterium]
GEGQRRSPVHRVQEGPRRAGRRSSMRILITGASGDIGRAVAKLFVERGHEVHGIDTVPFVCAEAGIDGGSCDGGNDGAGSYVHHIADVTDPSTFPADLKPEVIVNCAGVQTDTGIETIGGADADAAMDSDVADTDANPNADATADAKRGAAGEPSISEMAARDIDVNLKGTINITERYAFGNEDIKAVVNIGSASGHTGSEFPVYAASKGGVIAYTKNIALRLAPRAMANSIDPGGVVTELNDHVMKDERLWKQIMDLTPMKRWAEPEEIAEWIYFVAVVNRSMTGQNLLIDGGEAGKATFVW